MKVVVTGITGFVGQNLSNYFSNENVIGVSRTKSERSVVYAEVPNVLQDASAFIHLAGKAHDLKKTSSDDEYFTVNRDLTIQLFDQFLESNCPVFIYMSSVKAVADVVEGAELTEESPANPVTAYGKSKQEAEEYILKQTIPSGKYVYILRPCMIHGPLNKGNLNLLYQFVAKGIPYPLASFVNNRSFLSVENLCFIIDQLISKKPAIGVYQVADNGAASTNELVQIIGKAMNKKVKLWRLPQGFVKFIARIGDVLHLPLNTERLTKLTENYVVSNRKIKEALQIELPLSLEEGLLKTIQSFKD